MPEFRPMIAERLGSLRLRPEREAEVLDELASQALERYEESVRSGVHAAEAERIALAQFGDWTRLAREIEEADRSPDPAPTAPAGGGGLAGIGADIRYAMRQFTRRPGLAVLAAVTLAFAIGANTAIYSVVHAVLVQPLPYPAGDRIVALDTIKENSPEAEGWSSLPDFHDARLRISSFEVASAVSPVWNHTLMFETADYAEGLSVSASFAELTGVRMVAGRFFTADEDRAGGPRVAAVSRRLAEQRFGSAQGALARPLNVDGFVYTIIGVMPSGFEWLGEPVAASASKIDVWTPISTSFLAGRGRGLRWIRPVARLRAGSGFNAAQEEFGALGAALAKQYPDSNAGFRFRMRPLKDSVTGAARTPLLLLMALVGFVLLIACGNVANLLLARALERRREVAVRVALGASGWRIVQQSVVETGLLAIAGGVAGVMLAGVLVFYAIPAYGSVIPRRGDVALNWPALLFSGAVTIVCAVLAGSAPAWQMLRWPAARTLRDGERGSTTRHRVRAVLVAAQLALSLVLLTTAGLLAMSLQRLLYVDPGFAAAEVATLSTKLPTNMRPEARFAAAKHLQTMIAAMPGVKGVGIASRVPMMGQNIGSWMWVEGRSTNVGDVPEVEYRIASDSYFATMGIPLRAGRLFDSSDERHPGDVVVVNEAVAQRYFPGENPVGKRVRFADPKTGPWITIIGVVGSVRHFGLDLAPRPEIYRPYGANPLVAPILVVRSDDPRGIIPQVSAVIRAWNPAVAVFNGFVLQDLVDRSALRRKLPALLAIAFAALALGIAAVGLTGVAMNSVRQRRREFGVRMALGATVREVVGLVMRDNLRTVAAGAAVGLPVALLLAQMVRSMLYSTSPFEPAAWIGAPLVLAGIAAVACWLPARRAASIDPAETLRSE